MVEKNILQDFPRVQNMQHIQNEFKHLKSISFSALACCTYYLKKYLKNHYIENVCIENRLQILQFRVKGLLYIIVNQI